MIGTGGTKPTGITGSYANSWTNQWVGGAPTITSGTAVMSKSTPSDGIGEWQVLTFNAFTFANSGTNLQMYELQNPLNTKRLANGWYEFECEVAVTAYTSGFVAVQTYAYDSVSGITSFGLGGWSAPMPSGTTWSGVVRTAPQKFGTYTSGPDQLATGLWLTLDGTAPVTATIQWRRCAARRLPNNP